MRHPTLATPAHPALSDTPAHTGAARPPGAVRRTLHRAIQCALLAAAGALLGPPSALAAFSQTNLIATSDKYGAAIVDPTLVNAWGIAIRPAGLGGHFWITANGTGISSQWVGDVGGVPLYQDDLRIVTVPGPTVGSGVGPGQPQVQPGTPTGVAFNGGDQFRITQGSITNSPARFLFATDNGVISAWTERRNPDGSFDRPGHALAVIDRSAQGAQFFGIGVDEVGGRLYAADFGATPGLRVYDSAFADISASAGFANPFGGNYQPFNVQTLADNRVFVTYAEWGSPGEEVTGDGIGRVAEFAFDGSLTRVWGDGTGLNAPWGVAMAPTSFGEFAGHLLVGNFGDGSIAAFDPATQQFAGYLVDADGQRIEIEGLWGLQFGNGQSLGEADRLYFAAGPEDEEAGLFGSLSVVPEPPAAALWLAGLGVWVAARRVRNRRSGQAV
jgi:uncharacterized protein (TIGR03118 family)